MPKAVNEPYEPLRQGTLIIELTTDTIILCFVADQDRMSAVVSDSNLPACMCLCCPIVAEYHEPRSAQQDPRGRAGTRQDAPQRHAHCQTRCRPDDQGLHPGSYNATAACFTFFSQHGFCSERRFLFLMTLVRWPCNILTPSSKETTYKSRSSTRVCPKSSPSYPRYAFSCIENVILH